MKENSFLYTSSFTGFHNMCSCFICSLWLTLPESTMNLTPSMVMEVSAILVDMMHLRTPSGGTSNTCRLTDSGRWHGAKWLPALPDPVLQWTGHCGGEG